MVQETKSMGIGKILTYAGVVAGLVAGGVAVEKKFNIVDEATQMFFNTKDQIVGTVTTDPYDVKNELIEKIKEYQTEIDEGQFDLGVVVDEINQYRAPGDVTQDAVTHITQQTGDEYQSTIDCLVSGSSPEQTEYAMQTRYESLDAQGQLDYTKGNVSRLDAKASVEVVMEASGNFGADDYVETIPQMVKESETKFGNEYDIVHKLISDKSKVVGKWLKDVMKEGKNIMDQYSQ